LAALLLALCACSGDDDGAAAAGAMRDAMVAPPDAGLDPFLVQTRDGPVRGMALGGERVFRGIPYAAPPLGPLRFAAPRPPDPWQEPPPGQPTMCPQFDAETNVVGTEDCLTLDVWTPLAAAREPLPVMVWIHGGGFTGGSGFLSDAMLPARDVIVVAINYRLGPLGFLGHPALSAEGGGTSGNYAIEDQRLALEWVRDNAEAFGGDPQRVTIFGESAGGSAVCAQLWSPRSAGLFHRAIIESGALCGRASRTLADAEAQGERLAAALGCDDADSAPECLRAIPAADLIGTLAARTLLDDGAVWGPVVDGQNFERALPDALAAGDFNQVPTIVGANLNEGYGFLVGLESLTADEYAERVRTSPFFGAHADELLELYPASDFATPQLALAALVGHRVFNCPARRTARAIAATGTVAYEYLFAHGASLHAEELLYLFGAGQTESNQYVAEAMKDYWTRFAATGDPNGGEAVPWPRYEASEDAILTLGDPVMPAERVLERECDVWDEFEP
jgi:para-nitrobenzyl esterase